MLFDIYYLNCFNFLSYYILNFLRCDTIVTNIFVIDLTVVKKVFYIFKISGPISPWYTPLQNNKFEQLILYRALHLWCHPCTLAYHTCLPWFFTFPLIVLTSVMFVSWKVENCGAGRFTQVDLQVVFHIASSFEPILIC